MEKFNYTKFNLTPEDILWEARQRCLIEMYARAQPSADYNQIYAKYKEQQLKGETPEAVYDRYYLSKEEFEYIRNKYIQAYNLEDRFKDYCDILIRDMRDGCSKDKYIPEKIGSDGERYPGYRGYEKVPPIKYIIGEESADAVINFINERKNFYRFDQRENRFIYSVTLEDSPTSNAEKVKEYWKSQGIDLEIDPRHLTTEDFCNEEY